MASGWGNAFSAVGEGIQQNAARQRDDKIRAEERAAREQQFQLQMKTFLANEEQRTLENKMRSAQIQAANMSPDAAGSAGSINLDDPRLKAFEGPGSVYNRATPGMSLPSRSTQFGPDGAPIGHTTQPAKPTGKFVWNPSWEQQQQIDQRQEHVQDVQTNQNFQREMAGKQDTFQSGMQKSQQAFQAAQQQQQINASYAQTKLQIGNRMNPQQEIAMRTFDVMLAHQPKPGFDGTVDPAEWANWMQLAQGPMATLGIGKGGPAVAGAPSANDPLGLHGPGPGAAPVPPTPSQFLAPPPTGTRAQQVGVSPNMMSSHAGNGMTMEDIAAALARIQQPRR